MKSDFLLAFNQVCSDRGLSREVVLDALQTALESAYRRNAGIEVAQNVTATINMETGKAQVFIEKRVVEELTDPQLEISLADARALQPDAELEDAVMVESTPKDFGRIAAQNAKQIILQRIREAEREARYAHYVQQEGEIVHGTVQSIKSQVVTLHLEGTEAILPRSQQVPGERYTLHQRLRTYVLEVRKTNRGPQIVVSRSHKNMLRRLLELEVPEIFNGAVEIKSISREAGSRSKVAVAARQAGVDPVGACVGMRGVRIQSIVNELGGEKIDVIEWSPDVTSFIAKSLSPAKVLSVQLQEEPVDGKTANVVVPDDQLSLAIGRAGQNARLAAKLTGWRIDIQGVTEAATWALKQVNEDSNVLPALGLVAELLPNVANILRQHEQEKLPYNSQELLAMRQVIEGVSSYYAAIRGAERARRMAEEAARLAIIQTAEVERRSAVEAALALVPPQAYEIQLTETDLSARVLGHLQRAELATAGDVMERLAEGDEGLLKLDGIGPKSLAEVKRCLEALELPEVEVEPEPEVVTEEVAAEEVVAAEEAIAEEISAAAEAEQEIEELPPVPTQAYDILLPYIGLGKRLLSSLEKSGVVTIGDVMGRLAEGSESLLELDGVGPEGLAEIKQGLEAFAALVSEEDESTVDELEVVEETPVEEAVVEEFLVEKETGELLFEEEELEGRTKEDERRRRRQLVLDEESGEVVALRRRKRGDDVDVWGNHLK